MYLYVFKFNNHLTTVWHSTKTESKSLRFSTNRWLDISLCQDKLQSVQPSSSKYENINFNSRTSRLTESFCRYLSLNVSDIRLYSLREAFSWKIKIPLCSQFLFCYEQESWKSINGGLCLRSFSFWILSYILTVLTCHKKKRITGFWLSRTAKSPLNCLNYHFKK